MPASAVPVWVVGRYVTAFTLIAQTVGAGGVLTAGTSAALAGIWDEIDLDFETENEEISAADTLRQNFVILKDLHRIRLVQILAHEGLSAGRNVLANAWGSGAVYQMNLTRGANTYGLYVIRTGYTENIRKGRSVGIFTAAIVDAGAATYA